MKKENDEITDLFRTRLADAGMSVRDGFWEELSQEIPVACQHRRRILLFRVAAAASVLLVLAASSATFLYFSPKEEMEEAFTKIAVTNGGQMDGDGIRVNQLPLPVEPVLPKPAPKSYGMLSQYTEEEDSLSITFSMSFSFSSTTIFIISSIWGYIKGMFTPKGNFVAALHLRICSRKVSGCMEPAPINPSPPALLTAEARRQPLHHTIPP